MRWPRPFHWHSRGDRLDRLGVWECEVSIDFSCLMVGINWNWDALRAVYVHVGPVIIGVSRWMR